jgi:Ca2+/H+ antiporter
MEIKEIAKELAVACLSQRDAPAHFVVKTATEADAAESGERLGAFYNAIYRTVLKAFSSSSQSTS